MKNNFQLLLNSCINITGYLPICFCEESKVNGEIYAVENNEKVDVTWNKYCRLFGN